MTRKGKEEKDITNKISYQDVIHMLGRLGGYTKVLRKRFLLKFD